MVRLEPSDKALVDKMAVATDMAVGALGRAALMALAREWERKGSVTVPIQFRISDTPSALYHQPERVEQLVAEPEQASFPKSRAAKTPPKRSGSAPPLSGDETA